MTSVATLLLQPESQRDGAVHRLVGPNVSNNLMERLILDTLRLWSLAQLQDVGTAPAAGDPAHVPEGQSNSKAADRRRLYKVFGGFFKKGMFPLSKH